MVKKKKSTPMDERWGVYETTVTSPNGSCYDYIRVAIPAERRDGERYIHTALFGYGKGKASKLQATKSALKHKAYLMSTLDVKRYIKSVYLDQVGQHKTLYRGRVTYRKIGVSIPGLSGLTYSCFVDSCDYIRHAIYMSVVDPVSGDKISRTFSIGKRSVEEALESAIRERAAICGVYARGLNKVPKLSRHLNRLMDKRESALMAA